MQFGKLIKDLAIAAGWAVMLYAFGLYLRKKEFFELLPPYILITAFIILVFFGIVLILYRNRSNTLKSEKEGIDMQERVIHINAYDDLKLDIISLLTFSAIIGWVLLSPSDLDGNDFVQALIAYLGIISVRRIYKEKFYT